jgi:hypothetical protein
MLKFISYSTGSLFFSRIAQNIQNKNSKNYIEISELFDILMLFFQTFGVIMRKWSLLINICALLEDWTFAMGGMITQIINFMKINKISSQGLNITMQESVISIMSRIIKFLTSLVTNQDYLGMILRLVSEEKV